MPAQVNAQAARDAVWVSDLPGADSVFSSNLRRGHGENECSEEVEEHLECQ